VVDVLVVDDEPGISRIIRLLLQSEGLDVVVEPHAPTALKLAANQSVGLVLLDLNMPEMNGREFFRKFRQTDEATPVVIMSANDARSAYRELGANGYLNKPFSPEDLLETVERVSGARS
jgi:DNA-binding response OmpR family regulator